MSPRDRRWWRTSDSSGAGHADGEQMTAGGPLLMPGVVALVLVGVGLAVIYQESFLRDVEARAGAELACLVRLVPARSVGTSVIFPLPGRVVGYTVSTGCGVAFFVAPFFFIAAIVIVSRRIPLHRGLMALAFVTLAFFVVNQTRFLVVTASMKAWGFETGYRRSHIFLGTIVSTLGVVAGLLLFVWLLVHEGSRTGTHLDPGTGTG